MTAVQYDGPITIAVGQSRRSTQWQNRDLMWSQLVNRLEIPERTQESAKEYKALPKAQRDEIKDVGGFVGGVLKGGRRKADAITQRRLLTLDLDEVPADADPWDTVILVLGCAAVLYSTHSHRPDAPRLRLVMPLSRAVSPEEYAAVARKIAQDIGIDMCDDTTYEPHRLMYWPSLSYDAEYRYEFSDGPWLDVDEQLKRYVDWHDPAEWPVSSRRAEALHRLAKKQGDPTAKDGVVGAFCSTYSVEDAIEEFLPDVYEKCDDGRYTFKGGSTTGGLVLYDNGLFAYSHHGTDPASGKLCNAFDLVRIHLFGNQDDAAAPGTPSSRLPSFVAMADEALQIPEVREELARKRLQKISEQFDEDDASADEGEEDILSKFKVGPAALSRMFGVSEAYCGDYLKKQLGITFQGRTTRQETLRFLNAYRPDRGPVCADKKNTELTRVSLTFCGGFSPETIAARLQGLFPTGAAVSVTVDISAVEA